MNNTPTWFGWVQFGVGVAGMFMQMLQSAFTTQTTPPNPATHVNAMIAGHATVTGQDTAK